MKTELAFKYVENYLFQKYQSGVSIKTLEKELLNRNLPKVMVEKLIKILEIEVGIKNKLTEKLELAEDGLKFYAEGKHFNQNNAYHEFRMTDKGEVAKETLKKIEEVNND